MAWTLTPIGPITETAVPSTSPSRAYRTVTWRPAEDVRYTRINPATTRPIRDPSRSRYSTLPTGTSTLTASANNLAARGLVQSHQEGAKPRCHPQECTATIGRVEIRGLLARKEPCPRLDARRRGGSTRTETAIASPHWSISTVVEARGSAPCARDCACRPWHGKGHGQASLTRRS